MGLTDLIKKTTNGTTDEKVETKTTAKAGEPKAKETKKSTKSKEGSKKTSKVKNTDTVDLDSIKAKLREILYKYQGTDFEITQMKQDIMESFEL